MRVLIAVIGCAKRFVQMEAQRATWVKDSRFDVRFFLARQSREPLADEVFLDVDDSYLALPEKVRAANQWAYEQDYHLMLKTDDDTVIFPTRIVLPQGHYTGWKQEPQDGLRWCSGLAYWTSRHCMQLIANAEITPQDQYEDRWVGSVLAKAGIEAQAIPHGGIQWCGRVEKGRQKPLPPNIKAILSRAYVAGEFTAEAMAQAYRW